MSNVTALLSQRLKKSPAISKMSEMARHSTNGTLNSFANIFSLSELSHGEKASLEAILDEFSPSKKNDSYNTDLEALTSLTMEVKAITNQAAILHGERIKKAQEILKKYRDGAFTAWLMTSYGNRQTPYNFLVYYEFHQALPQSLRPQLEIMPRQAIYTLASREGDFTLKRRFVENYHGETKNELLTQIRMQFPLPLQDRRRVAPAESAILALRRICNELRAASHHLTPKQKVILKELSRELHSLCQ